MAAVVTIVPWRPGQAIREWNWEVARRYLKKLGYPIVLGDCDGPWSPARAKNAAAASVDWDVAIFSEADSVTEPKPMRRAVQIVTENRGAIRPHDRRWNLSEEQSRLFASHGPKAIGVLDDEQLWLGGGPVVVHREAFEAVGGFRQDMVGWGHEDSVFNTRLLVEASWDRIEGQSWHLWHEREEEHPDVECNRRAMDALLDRYRETIDRVSAERGWDVGAVL